VVFCTTISFSPPSLFLSLKCSLTSFCPVPKAQHHKEGDPAPLCTATPYILGYVGAFAQHRPVSYYKSMFLCQIYLRGFDYGLGALSIPRTVLLVPSLSLSWIQKLGAFFELVYPEHLEFTSKDLPCTIAKVFTNT